MPAGVRPKTQTTFAWDDPGTAAAVTVCIPLHDYERHIEETLDSVARQTLSPVAVTVVDDGSNDRGPELVERWMASQTSRFSRLRLLRHQGNAGLAAARNTAIADATSDWVFPLDADNLLRPRCLETLLDAASSTEAAFLYPILEQFDGADLLMGCDAWSREQLAEGNYIDAMALVRRSAWERLGGYHAMRTPGWEDYDFWCRGVEASLEGLLVPQILGRYRLHAASMLRETTDTLRNHLDVCDEMRAAHPWVRFAGGGSGSWRTSALAHRAAAIAPIGRIAVPRLELANARARRSLQIARTGITRLRLAVRGLRAARAAGLDPGRATRIARLCLDPTCGPALQRATGAASTPPQPALLGAPGAEPPERRPIRIGLYASSLGNQFFREMAEHLAAGLESSDAFAVTRCDEHDDPDGELDEHLIVAPHEFFGLGRGLRFAGADHRGFRRRATLFMAEQLATTHYAHCLPWALEARLVLDLNPSSAQTLRTAGAPAHFFPLGHLPDPLWQESASGAVDRLAENGLAMTWLAAAAPPAEAPLIERPVEIAFNGVFTERRARFFADNAAFFAARRHVLLMPTALRPLGASVPSALDAESATALARRSRIQLNLHRGALRYFEWHRLAVRGFWNGSLVVSEPCEGASTGFEPGVHYLEAETSEMPELLSWALDSPDGRERAEQVRSAAYERLRRSFDLRTWCRALAERYRAQA